MIVGNLLYIMLRLGYAHIFQDNVKQMLIFLMKITDDVPYIWTSGRLCDFKGCEGRRDLEPKNIRGWFWSANREKITPTNQVCILTII